MDSRGDSDGKKLPPESPPDDEQDLTGFDYSNPNGPYGIGAQLSRAASALGPDLKQEENSGGFISGLKIGLSKTPDVLAEMLKWTLQGIAHFPKVEQDPRHLKFCGKIEKFLQENTDLDGVKMSSLFSAIEELDDFKDVENDPRKAALLKKYKLIKKQIEEEEKRRLEKQNKIIGDLTSKSAEIAKQDIDGQNDMWKWRLAQIILLCCGICGVDILDPALDLLSHMFSQEAMSMGHGILQWGSQAPGVGHIAGGAGLVVADYTPIIGEFNNVLFSMGSSDIGQAAGSILGPLAHSQIASIGFAAAFIGYGLFMHELPHRKEINEARKGLNLEIKDGTLEKLSKEKMDGMQKAFNGFAKEIWFHAKEVDVAVEHVTREINSLSLDLADNLHIFQGIEFFIEGQTKTIDKLSKSKRSDFANKLKKCDRDELKMILPHDKNLLDKIMHRIHLHEVLKDNSENPAESNPADHDRDDFRKYKRLEGTEKSNLFKRALKELKSDELKDVAAKIEEKKGEFESDKNKTLIRDLMKECRCSEMQVQNWIDEENQIRGGGNKDLIKEEEKEGIILDKLKELYSQNIIARMRESSYPNGNPEKPLEAKIVVPPVQRQEQRGRISPNPPQQNALAAR